MSNSSNVIYNDKARRMIDAITAAEARHLAERRAQEEECACKDGMFPTRAPTNRRAFLLAAGSTAGGAAAAVLGGAARAAEPKAPPGAPQYFDVPADPTKESRRARLPRTAAMDRVRSSKARSAGGFRPPT